MFIHIHIMFQIHLFGIGPWTSTTTCYFSGSGLQHSRSPSLDFCRGSYFDRLGKRLIIEYAEVIPSPNQGQIPHRVRLLHCTTSYCSYSYGQNGHQTSPADPQAKCSRKCKVRQSWQLGSPCALAASSASCLKCPDISTMKNTQNLKIHGQNDLIHQYTPLDFGMPSFWKHLNGSWV